MGCWECKGDLLFMGQINGVQHFQCTKCSKDIHVAPHPSLAPEPIIVLRIRWETGFLSARELANLRKVSPRAVGMSATEIWSESKEDGWLLGEFDRSQADRLIAQCTELGLKFTLDAFYPHKPVVTPFRVIVEWRSEKPSPQELLALRDLSTEAAAMTSSALLKRAREGEWLLGEVWPNQWQDLERRANRLGLKLRRES